MARYKLSARQKHRLLIQEKMIQQGFPGNNQPLEVLDMGTEFGHTGRLVHELLPKAKIWGLEIHKETYDGCRQDCEADVYSELLHGDAIAYLEGSIGFDICIAAELIEHLPKDRGWEMLRLIALRTRQLAIVTSPIGFKPQGPMYGNPHQKHLSGWGPDEFVKAGWRIYELHTGHSLGVYYIDKTLGQLVKP